MSLRIFLAALPTIFLGLATSAPAAEVLFAQNGYVVAMDGRTGTPTLATPGQKPKKITGDIPAMDGINNAIDVPHQVIIAHDSGGSFCPGGVWHVIDLTSAKAKALKAPCSEDTDVTVEGPNDRPIAVVRSGGRISGKILIR